MNNPTKSLKPKWHWWLGGAALAFALLQLARPPMLTGIPLPGHDLMATNPPPPQIAALLRGACYDCHSVETAWPWYSRLSPVSFWIADHVREGREKLNFSEWPHTDPARARKKFNHISETVRDQSMPLPSYTWIHTSARLSPAQREALASWAETEAKKNGKADE